MRLVNRVSAMVASHLLLVNHFLFGLTYNSPMSSQLVHPNAIDAAFDSRPHKMRHKKPPSLVTYSLAGNQGTETNSISLGDGCGNGCLHCSAINGCLSCRNGFFLSLRRDGPRQLAFCERSCPTGYYKTRYNGKGYCASCRGPGCSSCQAGGRCTLCRTGYTLDSDQGLCHRTQDNVSAPEISMPESDPPLPTSVIEPPQMPPIVDPPVLLTEKPLWRRSQAGARKKKKIQRSGRRKLKRRKLGVQGSTSRLPRRRKPQRRRRPPPGNNRVPGVPTNRQNRVVDSRSRSNQTVARPTQNGASRRRRPGRLNQPHNRTRGTTERRRRISRRRKLKKKHRKRRKKVLQLLSKKRSRGVALQSAKLNDEEYLDHLPLRKFQPEVTLARPSRHVLKEGINATRPWTQVERTTNRTLHDNIIDGTFNINNNHSLDQIINITVEQSMPENIKSVEKVTEHLQPNDGTQKGLPPMRTHTNFGKNRKRASLRSHAMSRNVTGHRRPKLRFRRRRRRMKQGKLDG